jgi:hypothetical protein
MRRKYSATVRDRHGNIVAGASVSVFLAGTVTPASIYTTLEGTTAVSGTVSDEAGRYIFYVDTFDYDGDQTFKIICSKGTMTTITHDNVYIEDIVLGEYDITESRTVTTTVAPPRGVTYNVAAGKTLTFSGSFSAGLYQVFTGDGLVVFGAGAVKECCPAWFGTGAPAESKARSAIAAVTWPMVYQRVTLFYGTGVPPDASTVPEGSIYFQYTI